MHNYTQDQLDELIACEKLIVEPPKKSDVSRMGSLRNDMKVQCQQGRRFHVFMRKSESFEEDFSIGLQYEPPGGTPITLLRCNGPHGPYVKSPTDPLPEHFSFHIHRASKENIENGFRPEAGAELTDEYASYDQALKCFLRLANIRWTEKHFPFLERRLFDFP